MTTIDNVKRVAGRLFEKTEHTRRIEALNDNSERTFRFRRYAGHPRGDRVSTHDMNEFLVVNGEGVAEEQTAWVSEEKRIQSAQIGAHTQAMAIEAFAELMVNYFDTIVVQSLAGYNPEDRAAMQDSIFASSMEEVRQEFALKLNERRQNILREMLSEKSSPEKPKNTVRATAVKVINRLTGTTHERPKGFFTAGDANYPVSERKGTSKVAVASYAVGGTPPATVVPGKTKHDSSD